MKRLLPAPLMSIFLWLLWLLLNQSLALAHLVLGAALALVVPALIAGTRPRQPRIRRAWLIPGLLMAVVVDIVISCVRVVVIVLGRAERRQHSGFMDIPLELQDPHGLAVLSAIINSTPGTVWAELSDDRQWLRIHVLDLRDEQAWVDTIKTRYEKPLMEIFQ